MKEGQWALIAGSAEGLGEAFTTLLAAQGFNLILADRQEEPLKKIADKIERKNGIKTVRLRIDLADDSAWETCMNAARAVDCRILVYNAAMSEVKPFLDHKAENLDRFIKVNNRTAILLVRAFAGHLRDSGKPGRILLMSSLAGLIAPVFVAPYAASKAFITALARSLFYELRPYNIGISVCCAGIIDTPKFLESKAEGSIRRADPAAVAQYALRMCGKKAVCIPGWMNRLNYFFLSRILHASLSSYFVNRAMRKMYPTVSR
ncbi:MAG: SDR family NAD(P)-dependent oxidoreductase [Bacteroidetes bacterium]|nr:SDR family NAD(P)-dependent oxidoreductase [Bacteroidota bacterium]